MCGFKSVDLLAILLNHSLESQNLWSRFTPLGKSLSLQLRNPTSPACWSAGGILFPPTTCWQSRWRHSLIHHLRTHSTGVTGSPEGTLWGQTFFIPLALLHCKIPARLILWLHNYVNRKNFKCRLIYLMLIFFFGWKKSIENWNYKIPAYVNKEQCILNKYSIWKRLNLFHL